MIMTKGEGIALSAMKKELKSLSKRHLTAKNKTESCMGAASVICQCRIDANEIIRSKKPHDEQMKLISVLADKEKAAFKISRLDLLKLMDKETSLMIEHDSLQHEISTLEFRYSMRR
tara:strand:- start:47 stop:397 length:351 start_codon:yes stop_codon:yes gene_type:complete